MFKCSIIYVSVLDQKESINWIWIWIIETKGNSQDTPIILAEEAIKGENKKFLYEMSEDYFNSISYIFQRLNKNKKTHLYIYINELFVYVRACVVFVCTNLLLIYRDQSR